MAGRQLGARDETASRSASLGAQTASQSAESASRSARRALPARYAAISVRHGPPQSLPARPEAALRSIAREAPAEAVQTSAHPPAQVCRIPMVLGPGGPCTAMRRRKGCRGEASVCNDTTFHAWYAGPTCKACSASRCDFGHPQAPRTTCHLISLYRRRAAVPTAPSAAVVCGTWV